MTPGDPSNPSDPITGTVRRAARNETIGLPFDFAALPAGPKWLRVSTPRSEEDVTMPATAVTAYSVAEVPVDLRRAGFIRHTGQTAENAPDRLPRALLPWQAPTETDAGPPSANCRSSTAPSARFGSTSPSRRLRPPGTTPCNSILSTVGVGSSPTRRSG